MWGRAPLGGERDRWAWRCRAALVGSLALMMTGGCGKGAEPAEVARGGQVYARFCALCHGAQGEGQLADSRAPALGNPEFLAAASDEFLRAALVNGRPGTSMSAFAAPGGPLSAADADDTVAFMRSWMHGPPAVLDESPLAGDIARGGRLFVPMCVGCHGAHGEGAAYQSLANREFLRTATPGYLRHALRHGRPGTNMPAVPGIGGDDQGIDDLVAIILSW